MSLHSEPEAAGSRAAQLSELSRLHESGALSDDEFLIASATVGCGEALGMARAGQEVTASTLSRLAVLHAAHALGDVDYVRAAVRAVQSGSPQSPAGPVDAGAAVPPTASVATRSGKPEAIATPQSVVQTGRKGEPAFPNALTVSTTLLVMLTCGEVLSVWFPRWLGMGIVAGLSLLSLILRRLLSARPVE